MYTLAIIPARAGSKGVINKNKRIVGGRPLVEWTLSAVANISEIDVLVTSDDDDVLSISKNFPVTLHKRPRSLAGDTTPMSDVILDALAVMQATIGKTYDNILLLQPTAPLRRREHLLEVLDLAHSSTYDSIMSVYKVDDCHPARMYTLEDSHLIPYATEPSGSLRQDLPDVYHRNGAIYLSKTKKFLETKLVWGGRTLPYIMAKSDSVNIDDETDLKIADFLLSAKEY
ncbi:acylneuraminate cytidylyltransferase family protein [Halodesulfovibrio aestuarii]|uniref:Acylneuraminate cytidylyltransferase family protein n=1 Tax=Halodesulfovibrio aestuarii TaxID=126333 RepID=A0ABV4JWE3_9BACT